MRSSRLDPHSLRHRLLAPSPRDNAPRLLSGHERPGIRLRLAMSPLCLARKVIRGQAQSNHERLVHRLESLIPTPCLTP